MLYDRIGHFRILEKLGQGGMGVVYLAFDEELHREVALKLVTLEGEEARERFVREARAAAALNHPAIVQIHQILRREEAECIVMERVRGQTLRHRLRGGPLPVAEAVPILRQIAEGLEAAHDRGFVHRDLKTDNVMLDEDGRAKILDFGLAKHSAETGITGEGRILGTVRYMSPEQASGEAVDQRSDLFSLGVLAYEMIAGKAPFGGGTVVEVLARICTQVPPSLAVAVPGTPGPLVTLVERLLEKSPERRPQGAGAVALALADLASGETATLPAEPLESTLRPWAKEDISPTELDFETLPGTEPMNPPKPGRRLGPWALRILVLLTGIILLALAPRWLYEHRLVEARKLVAAESEEARHLLEDLAGWPRAVDDGRLDYLRSLDWETRGRPDNQVLSAQRGARKAREQGDDLTYADARLSEARGLLAQQKFQGVEELIEEALVHYRSLGNIWGEALTLEQKAQFHLGIDKAGDAITLFEQSLEGFARLGSQARGEAVRLRSHIARAHYDLDELSKALDQGLESLRIYGELGDDFGQAYALELLGTVELGRARLDEAERYYRQSLELFERLGDVPQAALLRTNLGEVLYYRGELAQAGELHKAARESNLRQSLDYAVAWDSYRLALVEQAAGRPHEALRYYKDALDRDPDLIDAARERARLRLRLGEVGEVDTEVRDSLHPKGWTLLSLAARLRGEGEEAKRWAQRALDEVAEGEGHLLRLEVAIEAACSTHPEPAVRFAELAEQTDEAGLGELVRRARQEAESCGA